MEIQTYSGTEVWGYKGIVVQKYRDIEVQGYRGIVVLSDYTEPTFKVAIS